MFTAISIIFHYRMYDESFFADEGLEG